MYKNASARMGGYPCDVASSGLVRCEEHDAEYDYKGDDGEKNQYAA
jgi:hypothetical protein